MSFINIPRDKRVIPKIRYSADLMLMYLLLLPYPGVSRMLEQKNAELLYSIKGQEREIPYQTKEPQKEALKIFDHTDMGQSNSNEEDLTLENNIDKMSHELIFKDGMRKALRGITNIDSIPTSGKMIDYYRDKGQKKGHKLTPAEITTMYLPDRFNIHPKPKYTAFPINSMVFQLGGRYFRISPWIGGIDSLYATSRSIELQTTIKNVSYTKESRLPQRMYELRTLGENVSFRGTFVSELTEQEFNERQPHD